MNTRITVIRSIKPAVVRKKYTLRGGTLDKSVIASITEGLGVTHSIPDAQTFAALLAKVTESDNLVLCPGEWHSAGSEPFAILPEETLAELTGSRVGEVAGGVIEKDGKRISARLKRGIDPSCWLLMDADAPPGMPPELAALNIHERLMLWDAILPGISKCERIELRSSSARVRRDGATSRAATHAWLRVNAPLKIGLMKAHVGVDMVNRGLSFPFQKLSRSPKTKGRVVGIEHRGLFDLAVFVAGRLVFCAKPDVSDAPGYVCDDAGITVVNPGGGELDLSFLTTPDKAALDRYRKATGISLEIKATPGGGGLSVVSSGQLTLATEITRRGVTKPLSDWVADMKLGDKLRCEAPFRESYSEAAFIRLKENGEPFVYDVGNGTTYRLEPRAFGSGLHSQHDARRSAQIRENIEIGEGETVDTRTDVVTLAEALDRYVYQSDGSRVSDRQNPRFETSVRDLAHLLAASTEPVSVTKADRECEEPAVVHKPVAQLWLRDTARKTVITRTFRPSHPEFTFDPHGLAAFNSWRPRPRVANADPRLAQLFLEHVAFVFGNEAEPFLDWLAHIEQFPGVLPHTAWLNIATRTGLGRNWIASVLVRLWRGNVAANVDLVGLIGSAFNGMLSNKLLAVVDEIREGGAGGSESWRFSERLKSIITEEMRTINPKYGRQSVEWNCCRWLLFSNHRSALKLTDTDRRFNVSICDEAPRSPAYYAELYGQLSRPGVIDAVAAVLGSRDLSKFNPGARAIQNDAKAQVISLSKNEAQMTAEAIVKLWPADLITLPQVRDIMGDYQQENRLGPGTRYALEDAGIRALDRRARVDGQQVRVLSVRDHARWASSSAQELALHIKGKLPDVSPTNPGAEGRWRRYLELLEERAG